MRVTPILRIPSSTSKDSISCRLSTRGKEKFSGSSAKHNCVAFPLKRSEKVRGRC